MNDFCESSPRSVKLQWEFCDFFFKATPTATWSSLKSTRSIHFFSVLTVHSRVCVDRVIYPPHPPLPQVMGHSNILRVLPEHLWCSERKLTLEDAHPYLICELWGMMGGGCGEQTLGGFQDEAYVFPSWYCSSTCHLVLETANKKK